MMSYIFQCTFTSDTASVISLQVYIRPPHRCKTNPSPSANSAPSVALRRHQTHSSFTLRPVMWKRLISLKKLLPLLIGQVLKQIKRSSKPGQQGPCSSIRLETMYLQTRLLHCNRCYFYTTTTKKENWAFIKILPSNDLVIWVFLEYTSYLS